MTTRGLLTLALLLGVAPLNAALAQGGPPAPKPVSAADRHAVLQALSTKLQANYVFPGVAKSVSAALLAKDASGGYLSADNTKSFAEALSKDLRELSCCNEAGIRQRSADP